MLTKGNIKLGKQERKESTKYWKITILATQNYDVDEKETEKGQRKEQDENDANKEP